MTSQRVMEADMLTLHRRHLISCGVPTERANAVDAVPTSRQDLRDHYAAILNGDIVTPEWAKGLKL